MSAIWRLDRNVYMASAYIQVSTTEFGKWWWSTGGSVILKEPQRRNIGKRLNQR